jgi:hypothetical protein
MGGVTTNSDLPVPDSWFGDPSIPMTFEVEGNGVRITLHKPDGGIISGIISAEEALDFGDRIIRAADQARAEGRNVRITVVAPKPAEADGC